MASMSGSEFSDVFIDLFTDDVVGFLKKGEAFSFSDVFVGDASCFLVFKYSFLPQRMPSLEDDWVCVESFALNKKRVDLFDLWIKEQKEKTYVKINSF